MREHLPDAAHFMGKTLPNFPNYTIVEHVGTGFNGHVYRAHASEISSDLAFKFVPTQNVPSDKRGTPINLNEARKANILENRCVVRYVDFHIWADSELGESFVVFVCDYVPGSSLDKFISKRPEDVTLGFIETFLRTILDLLYEMQQRNMEHGDLHAGNVLVADSAFTLDSEALFRVTDFGIREITSGPHNSDFLHLAETLKKLLKCVDYRAEVSRNRYAFEVLRHEFLGRHLIETDPLADPLARNPEGLHRKLRALDDNFREKNREHASASMVTPFDYPNCEQMGNSHLLLRNLYSNRLLGLNEIMARSNLVLTGPRGCGKTTVFRALSLEYLLFVESSDLSNLEFIGVYYRCDDLYFSFPRYRLPVREEAIDIPMHFVVVSLAIETLRYLSSWAERQHVKEFQEKEVEVTTKLWDVFGLAQPSGPASQRFAYLVSRLLKQRTRAAKKQRFCHVPTEPIEGYVGPRALMEFCAVLRSEFSFLQDRPFFYFIDDYSTPKITGDLQQCLNRLFMHRSSDMFFKISTESPISFERRDIDGKEYVEEREYKLLNLGLRYLRNEGGQVEAFLADLFEKRFREIEAFRCDTLVELLGENNRNENETARQVRAGKGNNTFFGIQTVTAMCSGDIHSMIRLVEKMVEDAGGMGSISTSSQVPRIAANTQSSTVRRAAGEFMESVRTLPQRGEGLAKIVSAIGNVASSYMRYRDARNETGNPPHQASRIEPYEPLCLSQDAQDLLNDLIRFSILLVDPRGKSRRGNIVPRFYLRRYLIPHFNLTFSKRDSLELENAEIELLLVDPAKFQETKRLKEAGTKEKRGTSGTSGQKELFERVSVAKQENKDG